MNQVVNLYASEREAEAISSKASRAEFSKDYDQAFKLYIKAAEAFLHLSRVTGATDTATQRWKSSAKKSLERAEKIKRFVEASRRAVIPPSNSDQQPAAELHLTPVAIDHFSHQEQLYVLKRGSHVNGLIFPLWDDPISMPSCQSVGYIDPDGQPKLSPDQERVSPIWRRPGFTLLSPATTKPSRRILPQEILQHVVTDCSVCASISVCLEHGRRFGSTLAESSVRSLSDGQLVNGRYDIRILFNGAWRRIGEVSSINQLLTSFQGFLVVDDQLPFHPTEGTVMCMSILSPKSTEAPDVEEAPLWPSLLEKAYMKLMGGYDFPGSNSSIDLHALAGWIPEHIETKRSHFEREKTWERIESGFSAGQCVVTLGTGPTPYTHWRDTALLPSHSYAVIDAYESEEGRMFTVLDSWVGSDADHNGTSRALHIPWSEVLNTFDGVYLSWDPDLWRNKLIFHGMWRRTRESESGIRHLRVEFKNDSLLEEEIWVLLTRHTADTLRISDFISLHVEIEDEAISGVNAVENQHILASKSTYTNSTHVLVRTRISPSQKSGILSISASYEGKAQEVGFTLTTYAREAIKTAWIEHTPTPPYTETVEVTLSSKNAGGNCTYPSFMVNPQYRLALKSTRGRSDKAKVTLTIKAGKDVPVNVAMVWSQGQRVSELAEKDLVATSGAYSYGFARVTKDISLTAGEYTVIASAFEPHHMGMFSLKIDSSHPFDFKPIPQEGAGMYSKTVRGSWEGESAAGAPSFNKYFKNPIYELVVPSTTRLKIRLQLLQPTTAVSLNVTMYSQLPNDVTQPLGHQRQIVTSGAYDDAISGVATPGAVVGPGKYCIVPSTYNPGLETEFRFIVYSSVAGIKLASVGRRT